MSEDKAKYLKMYGLMLDIRYFEEATWDLYIRGLMPGLAHLYIGEEAVAVGACVALRQDDWITSTHRGHGHCIAKGGDLKQMMAEIMGRKGGYCKGKGGSMHIADINLGILGANGIVGGGLTLATGAGFTSRNLGIDRVCVCFYGDGASNRGVWHESVNMASTWKLPVVYLCENNMYAISMPQRRAMVLQDIADRAQGYGIPGIVVDGMDVLCVYEATQEAVARARAGEGPSVIECKTYRYGGHTVGDSGTSYRTQEEIDSWKARDCIQKFRKWLLEQGQASEQELAAVETERKADIEAAVEFGKNSPYPDVSELTEDVFAD